MPCLPLLSHAFYCSWLESQQRKLQVEMERSHPHLCLCQSNAPEAHFKRKRKKKSRKPQPEIRGSSTQGAIRPQGGSVTRAALCAQRLDPSSHCHAPGPRQHSTFQLACEDTWQLCKGKSQTHSGDQLPL